MTKAAKILERMVNQNTYDEIAQGKLILILISSILKKNYFLKLKFFFI